MRNELCFRASARGRNRRSRNPDYAGFAFYDGDPPGKGAENWYSEYDAFALLTGLRLMQHGWLQAAAVVWMRRLKPQLKGQHARIHNTIDNRTDNSRLFGLEDARHQPVEAGSDSALLAARSRA
jgi:hypothetical protein